MGCYGAHASLTKLLMPGQWSDLHRRPSRFDLRAARNAEHWAVQPLEELWTLSKASLSVMVMMLWGFTVKQLLLSGIDVAALTAQVNPNPNPNPNPDPDPDPNPNPNPNPNR